MTKTTRFWGQTFAILGFSGVALGAIGAHSWESVLEQNATVGRYNTAILYWMYHTLAGLAVTLNLEKLGHQSKKVVLLFALGILLFSGSLIIGSFDQRTFWNYITPFGGLSFLIGWFFLFASFVFKNQ